MSDDSIDRLKVHKAILCDLGAAGCLRTAGLDSILALMLDELDAGRRFYRDNDWESYYAAMEATDVQIAKAQEG